METIFSGDDESLFEKEPLFQEVFTTSASGRSSFGNAHENDLLRFSLCRS
jgi:hypothetical protein